MPRPVPPISLPSSTNSTVQNRMSIGHAIDWFFSATTEEEQNQRISMLAQTLIAKALGQPGEWINFPIYMMTQSDRSTIAVVMSKEINSGRLSKTGYFLEQQDAKFRIVR